ncbi:MAG: PAS domain S-box protein [Thermomicrobiales bacterium]
MDYQTALQPMAEPPTPSPRDAQRLAAIVDSWPEPIIDLTLDGVIDVWNRAAEAFYGYSAEEAIGQDLRLIVPPDRADELAHLHARVTGGEIVVTETVRQTRDGQLREVSLTLFPVRDATGAIIGMSGATQDIGQRRQAALLLAASEERFRTAFDDAPNAMAIVSLEGRYLQVNRAGCALMGRTEDELRELLVDDVTHPDDVGLDRAAAAHALEGERGVAQEMRIVRPDGSVRWIQFLASLVVDADGAPLHFIVQAQDLTDSIATREQLTAARSLMQEVLDRTGSAFIEVERTGRIIQTNAVAEALLGRPRAALLGQLLQDVVEPEVLEPIMDALRTSMATGQRSHVSEVGAALGDKRLSMRTYPTVDGMAIFFREITTVRALEDELREAELRFQTLVEQLPAAVFMFANDPESTTFYLSPYFERMTGHSADRQGPFQGLRTWLPYVHPDDRALVVDAAETRAKRPGNYSMEYRFRRADGAYMWINDVYSAMLDGDGNVIAWLGVILDVTERKEASAAIAQLAAIVEASEDAIYFRTVDGLVIYWNPAAERLYGYTAAEIIGQPVASLFIDGKVFVSTSVERFTEGVPRRFEAQAIRKDGDVVDVAVTLFPVWDPEGRLLGISGIARDISDRIAAEREVRAALDAAQAGERAKGLFLAMMSHELRTPLQAVLGYADFLQSGRQGPLSADQLEDIGYIHQGASRMVHLIEQMLDLSRMEAGRLDLKQEAVDLRQVLEAVRQDIAPQAEARGLALRVSAPERLPAALGDAERVRQIVLNLAGNAVKFTEAGEVGLWARAGDGVVAVAVEDTGIGIAAGEVGRIFEEFRQVDSTLSRRHGGAGLGLAIAQRLAAQMGGAITVASEPGVGSTFTLTLPVAP